jgi:hypothetical protein
MDRDDVRVIEGRGGARLALEPFTPVRVAREGRRQHLQCDASSEPDVVGEVYLAHSTGAEQTLDAIVTELRSDHGSPRGFSIEVGLYGMKRLP